MSILVVVVGRLVVGRLVSLVVGSRLGRIGSIVVVGRLVVSRLVIGSIVVSSRLGSRLVSRIVSLVVVGRLGSIGLVVGSRLVFVVGIGMP